MPNLPTEIPDVIQAHRLEIIDRAGRTRITLGLTGPGEEIAELSIHQRVDPDAAAILGVGYEAEIAEGWPKSMLQLTGGYLKLFEVTERGIGPRGEDDPVPMSATPGTVGDLLADSVARDERQALAASLAEQVDELIPALTQAMEHLAVVEAAGDRFDIEGAPARALLHSCAGTDGMVEAFGRLARVLADLPAGPACEIEAAVAADR